VYGQTEAFFLQEKVFASPDSILRTEFSMVDLKAQGLNVRDDPAATRLYVKFIENQDGILNPPITPFVRPLNRKAL
jgi:hypothetical protein